MKVRNHVVAAGLAALTASFTPAAADEPHMAELTNFIDIDFFGIFPACAQGKAVEENAPSKDSQYCADMHETRIGTVTRLVELVNMYGEQLFSIDETKPGFGREFEALGRWLAEEENAIWAQERVECHAIQAAYIGEQGITVTIKPGKFIP